MEEVRDLKRDAARAGQFLTFYTAGEEYAIGLLQVKEIVEYSTVTCVPYTPAWVRGVINMRGNVVPVIDLAVKFGLQASTISKFSCIVVTEVVSDGEKLTLGVLADSVSQVIDLGTEEIEVPPPFGTRVRTEYLLGLGRIGKKFCLILNIDKVLSADELVAMAASVEAGEAPAEPGEQETPMHQSGSGA